MAHPASTANTIDTREPRPTARNVNVRHIFTSQVDGQFLYLRSGALISRFNDRGKPNLGLAITQQVGRVPPGNGEPAGRQHRSLVSQLL